MTYLLKRKNWLNIDMVNEANCIERDLHLFSEFTFPCDIPVLAFVASENVYRNTNWLRLHREQIINSGSSKVVVIQGHHYLHMVAYKRMSNDFVESY